MRFKTLYKHNKQVEMHILIISIQNYSNNSIAEISVLYQNIQSMINIFKTSNNIWSKMTVLNVTKYDNIT